MDEPIRLGGGDPEGLKHYDIHSLAKRVDLAKFPAGSLVVIGPRGGVRWAKAGESHAGVVQPDGTILVTWKGTVES